MILAALHFWEYSTNSLHLKCGPLTPALMDVAAITGLKPTGATFNPYARTDYCGFDFPRAKFADFIEDFHVTDDVDISAKEHIAFLTLWLSFFVFFSSPRIVDRSYMSLAMHLHEECRVNLSKLLLGSLYHRLRLGSYGMKNLNPQELYSISGPIWLFQLWFLATFKSRLQLEIPEVHTSTAARGTTAGLRLALLRPTAATKSPQAAADLFFDTFSMLLACDVFTPSTAPFADRSFGPEWFKRAFPATNTAHEGETNQI